MEKLPPNTRFLGNFAVLSENLGDASLEMPSSDLYDFRTAQKRDASSLTFEQDVAQPTVIGFPLSLPGRKRNFGVGPHIYALTGTIGSGKSSVSKLLKEHGARILCADEFAHEVVRFGSPALQELKEEFGSKILQPDGSLNRAALSEIVFHSGEKKKTLESILHPAIRSRYVEELLNILECDSPPSVVIYDVPLLFEAAVPRLEFEGVIVVSAPRSLCIERVLKRDPTRNLEQVEKILDSQWPIEKKEELADFVISNSGGIEELEPQVDLLWEKLN